MHVLELPRFPPRASESTSLAHFGGSPSVRVVATMHKGQFSPRHIVEDVTMEATGHEHASGMWRPGSLKIDGTEKEEQINT